MSRLVRPPYVDPNTQIIYDTDHPEFEGYLTKESMWLKDWRRRYFVLKGSKLFFCKNDYSAPHGMIDLANCTTVKSADLKSKKRNSFEISTPELTYLLYADTEKEKDDWIGNVGRAIVRCSSTYYRTNSQGPPPPGGGVVGGTSNAYGAAYGAANGDDDDDDSELSNDSNNPYFND
mmetsp:Transcript_11380/g.13762  ORF Transcript_11380/g.13762 Transcript_11380/m.13762 type:complete len:176 (+) Transcript_11380:190-717(+)|eukprot:CAMPEP_0195262720 /NCGR_PEP_ID=MMETSP0706-20130129/9910_1 /TAXON_ID=33640 /ORGANISM="Asterionellopsis glacialis, Strain CCMP134" /LENGTH=175 /DNA_ID=CAMNT_0040316829 /DNA_START=95 /DNA_END=622 /DNA_ORIENTATION=+